MKVAIIGSRGIPANYGGFETITEELSTELASMGYEVYVACESNFFKLKPYRYYKGVMLVYFPIINSIRVFSEFFYDLFSVIFFSFKADVIYMLGYTSIISLIFPRLLGKIVIVNVDGHEWKRRKHSAIIRSILKCFEILTIKIANYIVVDSHSLGLYYKKNYSIDTVYIPNAVREIEPYLPKSTIGLNLKELEYYLVVARLEPENNVDLIIEGFKLSKSKKKLVIVGNLKKTDYVSQLIKLKEKNDEIVFVGGIYDKKVLTSIRFYCYAHIHGHEVGGTNPSLLEALSVGNSILAFDVSYNREVAVKAALYFKDHNELAEKICKLESDSAICKEMKENALSRYRQNYKVENMVSTFVSFLQTKVQACA